MRLTLYLLALLFACTQPLPPNTPKNPTHSTPTTASSATINDTTPKINATLIVEIGEKSTGGAVGRIIRETLAEAGCTVLSSVEAEEKWKAQIAKKVEENDLNAASDLALSWIGDALILGEAQVSNGALSIKLRRLDPQTGGELWSTTKTTANIMNLPDEPRQSAREVALLLLEHLAQTPDKPATSHSTKLFFRSPDKPLSPDAVKAFRKALLGISELQSASMSESFEDTFVLDVSSNQDNASLAVLLDGKTIGGYRLTVTKATKDGLVVLLK